MVIGICDDVQAERYQLKKLCHSVGQDNIVEFDSGEALLADDNISRINLLFLDIEMTGIDGIDTKDRLEKIAPSVFIVFCTSHSEAMPDAFGKNVISFITKPYTSFSVETCIKKALNLSKEFSPIALDDGSVLTCGDILFLKSENKYTMLYTNDKQPYHSRKTISDWENDLLDYDFIRISRSSIINLKHYLRQSGTDAILSSGDSVSISRRYMSSFHKELKKYMLSKAGI